MTIPLGARVRFTRRYDRVEYENGYQRRAHAWEVAELPEPREGIFMGYRMKQNGSWESESDGFGYELSTYWSEDSRVKVALVVDGPWRDPWTVDPTSMEVVP